MCIRDRLDCLGVDMVMGYEESDLPDADLYVIGNALSRGNPSVEYILNQKLDYTSGPKILGEIIQDKTVIAVSGTHGKTSTSFLICEIFKARGIDVGFLVGGVSDSFKNSARLGSSNFFVVEADEYDSAFFDKRSKFIHYHPHTFIINNIEFDHADIFRDLEDVKRSFDHLIRLIPRSGFLLINEDDSNVLSLLPINWTRVIRVGVSESCELRITKYETNSKGAKFDLEWKK